MSKILIVDDDSKTTEAVAKALVSAGHTCAIQMGGDAALEFARRARPDLVVLDVMLPQMSGFELCRSIRRDHNLYMTPIIIVSGMNSDEEVEHGLGQGADDYITKPFDMGHLLQRVEALLRTQSNSTHVDSVTSLADNDGTRRELQRRISAGETFGLVYAEMMNLRSFVRKAGNDGREKATRHMARALQQSGRDFKQDEFFVGHMGAGHFLCVVPKEKAKTFCRRVRETWINHLETLYSILGQSIPDPAKREKDGLPLDIMLYETVREKGESVSAQGMMEVLSHIRNLHTGDAKGGIHLDRRSSEPPPSPPSI